MSDFKFICPSCGQKIKTDSAASGREFDCPGCQSKILIPSPAKNPGKTPSATLVKRSKPAAGDGDKESPPPDRPVPKAPVSGDARPKEESTPEPKPKPQPKTQSASLAASDAAGSTPVVKIPKAAVSAPSSSDVKATPKPPVQPAVANETAQSAPKKSETSAEAPGKAAKDVEKPTPQKPEKTAKSTRPEEQESASESEDLSPGGRVQIADLTPAIKRQIVRAARRQISNQEHWIPRLTEKGEYAYAAKMVDGKPERVEVTSPEATHFSILGAVMFELIRRNVTRTAKGRAEFLDHELLEAIQEVAGDETARQEAGPGELIERGKQVPPVSHSQCLEALELLEKRYTGESEKQAGAASERREDLRLAQLNRRIERKVEVSIEDLCAALSNELAEINTRLEDLERRS